MQTKHITAKVETMCKALHFGDSSSPKTFWECKIKTKENQNSKQEEKACLCFSHALQKGIIVKPELSLLQPHQKEKSHCSLSIKKLPEQVLSRNMRNRRMARLF